MNINKLALLGLVLFLSSISASAQAGAGSKVAVIDTAVFSDSKAGIKRLLKAYQGIDAQFKPQRDELTALGARLEALSKEITATQNTAGPAALEAKREQAANLQRDINRKREDAQNLYNRRTSEVVEPISRDVGAALLAFAKAKGYDVILDATKLAPAMFVVNDSIDITSAFVADYNAKNP